MTEPILKFSAATGTNTSFGIFSAEPFRASKPTKKEDVGAAVYAHIRAMRALGRTTVNTAEVAKALSLDVGVVDRAVAEMTSKGVKVLG
jgi:hypothetical protein